MQTDRTKYFLFAICLFFFSVSSVVRAQNSGEEIFESNCSACHTIGGGRMVGPDLSGVYQIRNNEWLISFIRSSQQMIKAGDSAAVAIYEEYNRIPMPDNRLSDAQILSVIDYIIVSDEDVTAADSAPVISDDSLAVIYSIEYASAGRELFYGHSAFENGAAPCLSCHSVRDQSFLGGGKLARDLTGSYDNLGASGITAIVRNSPFPVMKAALTGHDLSEDEIQVLISFLKASGEQENRPGKPALVFFSLGLVCALILLVHLYLFYDRRRIP
ncbi:MAG: c-type cytochrome [Bacteroidales bacterium]|jgi:mono/diheme cytochrome c family protein|nr:c-type cytochrome [Bacteroidales bacterium]